MILQINPHGSPFSHAAVQSSAIQQADSMISDRNIVPTAGDFAEPAILSMNWGHFGVSCALLTFTHDSNA
jgi:hypothetical protein